MKRLSLIFLTACQVNVNPSANVDVNSTESLNPSGIERAPAVEKSSWELAFVGSIGYNCKAPASQEAINPFIGPISWNGTTFSGTECQVDPETPSIEAQVSGSCPEKGFYTLDVGSGEDWTPGEPERSGLLKGRRYNKAESVHVEVYWADGLPQKLVLEKLAPQGGVVCTHTFILTR